MDKINWDAFKEAQADIRNGQFPVVDASDDWTLAESQADASHWDGMNLSERVDFMKAVGNLSAQGVQNV
jgi:hypothetical protein